MKKIYIVLSSTLFLIILLGISIDADGVEVSDASYYIPENSVVDPWKGGTLTLNNEYKVSRNDITSNPILTQRVNFKIQWKIPKGIDPVVFINSIQNNSTIEIGNQVAYIDESNFTYSGDIVIYTFSKSGFNFWALLEWLAALVFNPEVRIKTNVNLDVNVLSQNIKEDFSFDKVVTRGKLPPNELKKLKWETYFINRFNKSIANKSFELATWNSYISPWNGEQANSEDNGKIDDTQINDSLEVFGIERVLKGENFKTREISIPITKNINPLDYLRVINMYRKEVIPAVINVTEPETTDHFFELEGEQHLLRVNVYTFTGQDSETILSSVPLVVNQETILDMFLDSVPENISEGKKILLSGLVKSEGERNNFYYKINYGEQINLENKSSDKEKFDLEIEGMSSGTYNITLGVTNEYGLVKEVTFTINIKKEETIIQSVTEQINFGKHKLPKPGDKIFNELPFSIQVLDTYLETKEWALAARLEKPMQTDMQSLLPAEMFFNQKNKEPLKISGELAIIFKNNRVNQGEILPINFNSNEGIYLQMNSSNVRTNDAYHGLLEFILQTGP